MDLLGISLSPYYYYIIIILSKSYYYKKYYLIIITITNDNWIINKINLNWTKHLNYYIVLYIKDILTINS